MASDKRADEDRPISPPLVGDERSVSPLLGEAVDRPHGPLRLKIKFAPENIQNKEYSFHVGDLFEDMILAFWNYYPKYDWNVCKAIVEKPQPGVPSLIKYPQDQDFLLERLHGTTIRLLAPKLAELASFIEALKAAKDRRAALAQRWDKRVKAATKPASYDPYTFLSLRPLRYLPQADTSMNFLMKLRGDIGIKAAMKKHQWSVGLLTEMDPREHTDATHEGVSRTLGLNRNHGEVIELRLRTDDMSGWRDYTTVRKTLCHELAHNVYGPHDRKFWDLCHQIEREVAAADWAKAGRPLSTLEFAPSREDEVADSGAWYGGTYVLGGGTGNDENTREKIDQPDADRRLIIARAIDRRWSKPKATPSQSEKSPDEPSQDKQDEEGQQP
ncbi:WLM domain-containing protein [Lasiosphaeria ovina]|uniref:WLM domain-containing protein n=1 Tax=Lasiosphaeria ovina TaxID=92902 RepID=A0AAE0K7R6_9PEZI|nr:WLM domain-containing protein [Lasiosphaeria ovina]